ncbi:hypothetical protein [Streptomyces coerulescens]|uniref:Uncharacterized protein n=1 Tax=Streptomyces coerulescens TaxID=29304 RepID=A0ABW0CVY0_STRCD
MGQPDGFEGDREDPDGPDALDDPEDPEDPDGRDDPDDQDAAAEPEDEPDGTAPRGSSMPYDTPAPDSATASPATSTVSVPAGHDRARERPDAARVRPRTNPGDEVMEQPSQHLPDPAFRTPPPDPTRPHPAHNPGLPTRRVLSAPLEPVSRHGFRHGSRPATPPGP